MCRAVIGDRLGSRRNGQGRLEAEHKAVAAVRLCGERPGIKVEGVVEIVRSIEPIGREARRRRAVRTLRLAVDEPATVGCRYSTRPNDIRERAIGREDDCIAGGG